jgi:excinuclease ABC subunit C
LAHHRKRRSKASLHSELDEIKGVGAVNKKKLMSRFGSVAKIREASLEEIIGVAGRRIGIAVREYFD